MKNSKYRHCHRLQNQCNHRCDRHNACHGKHHRAYHIKALPEFFSQSETIVLYSVKNSGYKAHTNQEFNNNIHPVHSKIHFPADRAFPVQLQSAHCSPAAAHTVRKESGTPVLPPVHPGGSRSPCLPEPGV